MPAACDLRSHSRDGRMRMIIALPIAMISNSPVPGESALVNPVGGGGMPASAGIRHLLPAAALLLAYVLQCGWFARTQSITFDESIHTAVAQDVWRNHRFDQWMETPPLGHLLLGLLIHGDEYRMEIRNPGGWLMVTALTPGPERFILGPRMVNVALGVLLGILVWCAARDLFSAGAANFALALFAFSPQFIAHFTVATVDGIGVLTVFAVALQLVRWRRNPSWGQTLLLGATLGLALIAKFYAPPYCCAGFAGSAAHAQDEEGWRHIRFVHKFSFRLVVEAGPGGNVRGGSGGVGWIFFSCWQGGAS